MQVSPAEQAPENSSPTSWPLETAERDSSVLLSPHTPSAGEPLRTPSVSDSPQVSREGIDAAPESIGDARRESEDSSTTVTPTELSSTEFSVTPSPSKSYFQKSQSDWHTRFLREYKLVVVGGGGTGKSSIAIQVIVHQLRLILSLLTSS